MFVSDLPNGYSFTVSSKALGRSSSGVAAIRHGGARFFPAAHTSDKVRQYEQAHAEGTLKILLADQSALMRLLLEQELGCLLKFQAAAGTGKTILIIKYAAEWLYRMCNNQKLK